MYFHHAGAAVYATSVRGSLKADITHPGGVRIRKAKPPLPAGCRTIPLLLAQKLLPPEPLDEFLVWCHAIAVTCRLQELDLGDYFKFLRNNQTEILFRKQGEAKQIHSYKQKTR